MSGLRFGLEAVQNDEDPGEVEGSCELESMSGGRNTSQLLTKQR